MTTEKNGTDYQPQLAARIAESLEAPFPQATERSVHGRIQLPNKATVAIGTRRAGKTTFLHQMRRRRAEEGMTRERLPYLNLEDEQLTGLSAQDLGLGVEAYYRRFPDLRGRETVLWCFDEIQVVPEWERLVRRLLDSERVEVFLTGSSATLLSREIATAMRGRAWEVVIHPFSFEEALRHQGLDPPEDPGFVSAAKRSAVERAFLDYLEAGGFPEAQGLNAADRGQLLRDYVDVALFRDVVERHNVSNVATLRWMVRHLLANAAGQFSVEKFYKALRSQGLSVAKDTVHQLLGYLEDCFLVRTVWMEARSERQRMIHPRKAYPVDTGLIPLFDRSGRANLGHSLETAVLIELERRRSEVTYVRTEDGFEVDFLARRPAGKPELIQVSADARDEVTLERELRGLQAAAEVHPQAVLRLLTATADGLPGEKLPDGVVAEPAYAWMLRGPEETDE